MAFMMPVMKNDWDIYNSRRTSEAAGPNGRVRKVSESRSEGPLSPRRSALSPHRSAPTMRSLSYTRQAPAPSRSSLRVPVDRSKGSGSPSPSRPAPEKFHNRLVEKLKKALGRSETRTEERTS